MEKQQLKLRGSVKQHILLNNGETYLSKNDKNTKCFLKKWGKETK